MHVVDINLTDIDAANNVLEIIRNEAGEVTEFTLSTAANAQGEFTFNYQIADSSGAILNRTASIQILGTGNTRPQAEADSLTLAAELTPASIDASSLLANDSDADGDALQIDRVFNANNGNVSLDTNGVITFTPNAAFLSQGGSFSYQISDSNGLTSAANVSLLIPPNTATDSG